jgi:tetratricopeptide (TPR) repeat protein
VTTRQRIGLLGLLTFALAIRVALVLSLRGKPYSDVPVVDSAAYDSWAHDIATRSFWGDRVFYQDPLYPYFLGVFYTVFGRDLLAVRLVQAAIGTAGLWMLFEAARRFLGYRTALVALAIGAFYKTFIFYDAALLKEFLGAFFVEAALLFWSLDSKKWRWLAFGAALGAGTLVRGNLLLAALAAAGFLAVRKEWKPALLVLAGAFACILPATIRNLAVAGEFVLTTAQFGPNLYIGNNPENATGRYQPPSFLPAGAPEFEESGFRAEAERRTGRPMKASEVDAYWRGRAVEHIGGNLGTFLAVTGKRLLMLLSGYEIPDNYNVYFMERFSWVLRLPLFTLGLLTLPLAAAGIYLSWAERGRFALLYVLLGAYAVSVVFFFVVARYRLPLVPILVLFAAHAVVKASQMMKWRMRAVPRSAAGVFLGAAVLVNLPLPQAVGGHRDFRAAHYNLGVYYLQAERHAEAADEFESAARLNPNYLRDPLFTETLADLSDRAGRRDRAFELYEMLATELEPRSAPAAYKAGQIYFREGMYERAVQRFAAALRRDPRFAAAYEPLAEANRRLRNFNAALEALDEGTRVAPRDWSLRLRRAELFRELGMWKEALAAAEETLSLKPDLPEALRLRDEARRKVR